MKSVLITGASTGIGWTTALLLDQRGYRVLATVRKQADAERLKAAASHNLVTLLLDVTQEDQLAALADVLAEQLGDQGLHALINNAGIAAAAPMEFIPLAQLRYQLEVNVVGVIGVTQACIPFLRRIQGRIINITGQSHLNGCIVSLHPA